VADFDFTDVHEQRGKIRSGSGLFFSEESVTLSRFNTRFAALFVRGGGEEGQARHGIDRAAYQNLFDTLPKLGFRPAFLSAYSDGRDARFNAMWLKRGGPTWVARHSLTRASYDVLFGRLVSKGFRLVNVSGYSENGDERFLALFELGSGPEWQSRRGLSASEYQSSFDAMRSAGYVPVQVCGYRVNFGLRFAAIWQKLQGIEFIGMHNLTFSEYKVAFDDAVARGFRPVCVNGYSNSGVANYAAIWHRGVPSVDWQCVHDVDASGYQKAFEGFSSRGYRPAAVSGYGDGFYPS
jgi:hypothetical protein